MEYDTVLILNEIEQLPSPEVTIDDLSAARDMWNTVVGFNSNKKTFPNFGNLPNSDDSATSASGGGTALDSLHNSIHSTSLSAKNPPLQPCRMRFGDERQDFRETEEPMPVS